MRSGIGANHGSDRGVLKGLGIEHCELFLYHVQGVTVNWKFENCGCMLNNLDGLTRIWWEPLETELVRSKASVIPVICQFSGIVVEFAK